MSPEQVRGHKVDHRSDLFSLGCVLFEMLTGQRAFQRETAVATMTGILREDSPPLSSVKPPLPASLSTERGQITHTTSSPPGSRGSIISQRDRRIDSSGTPRRDVARRERDERQQAHNSGHGDWIVRADAK